jgi:hypothetical protein
VPNNGPCPGGCGLSRCRGAHGVDGRGRERGVAAWDDEAPAGSGIFAALVPARGENPGQNGGEKDITDEQGERMREADAGHALAQKAGAPRSSASQRVPRRSKSFVVTSLEHAMVPINSLRRQTAHKASPCGSEDKR